MKTPLPPPRRRERTQAQCRHRVGYFRHARGLCLVEDLVEAEYARIQISHQHRPDIGRAVEEYLDHRGTEDQHETRSLTRQRQRLLDQRSKLLQAHYADAIPLDLMKAEQARIGRQLEQVEARLAAHTGAIVIQKATLGKALDLLEHCHQLYLTAREADRRILNQAIFTRIWVYDESIAGDLDELLTLLTHPDLLALLGVHGPASRNPALAVDQTPQLRQEVTEGLAKPSAALVRSVGGQETNKPPFLGTGGSKEFDLVPPAGFEPAPPPPEGGALSPELRGPEPSVSIMWTCLLYTSDAADE